MEHNIPLQTINNYNSNYYYNNNYVNTFNTNVNHNNYNNSSGQEIEEKDDENHITLGGYSSIWCMLKLNPINYIKDNQNLALNLVGIGTSDSKIVLVNISEMNRAFGVNSNSSSTINADGYTEYAGALANEKCVDYGTYYECTATNASNNVIINVIARINGNVRANDNTHECYSAMINTNGIQSSKCGLNPALEPQ